jgi:hypothetical protein
MISSQVSAFCLSNLSFSRMFDSIITFLPLDQ